MARLDYDKAIEVNPSYFLAWCNRAGLHVHAKQWSQAIADASQAIALSPGYALSYRIRAIAYQSLGNRAAAIADFKQFLVLNPQSPDRVWIESELEKLELQS